MFFFSQVASEEELKKLEKEVREQEQLLSGYQLENERLYKELKQIQAKEKSNEARMFSENQKLGKTNNQRKRLRRVHSSCRVLLTISRARCSVMFSLESPSNNIGTMLVVSETILELC